MKNIILVLSILFSQLIFSGASILPDKDANGNIVQKSDPFASKHSYNFRGHGKKFTVAPSTMTVLEFEVPYSNVRFNGIHIINSNIGDMANLKILDTATGTYTLAQTGTAIPNATLNQFGFNWYLSNSEREILPYASDLFIGMRIVIEYTNNQASSKDIFINYYIHED